MSVCYHYHVIIVCFFTDVDWCSDTECEDTGLRYVCLPPLSRHYTVCFLFSPQTWTGVAMPPSIAVRRTGSVKTRDFVTSVYHHYHVIILLLFSTDMDWCSEASLHNCQTDRECEDTGLRYVCLPPLSRHYSVFFHRRGLV